MRKKSKTKKHKNKEDEIGGLAFVGCLMIGIGLGIAYGNTAIGTMIGLGVGFILMALIKFIK